MALHETGAMAPVYDEDKLGSGYFGMRKIWFGEFLMGFRNSFYLALGEIDNDFANLFTDS